MKEKEVKKAAIQFLEERAQMRIDGFPYCYTENRVQFHCKSCIKFWRERKATHK